MPLDDFNPSRSSGVVAVHQGDLSPPNIIGILTITGTQVPRRAPLVRDVDAMLAANARLAKKYAPRSGAVLVFALAIASREADGNEASTAAPTYRLRTTRDLGATPEDAWGKALDRSCGYPMSRFRVCPDPRISS